MRILTLSTEAEKCGIADYNDQVAAELREKGHEVTVFPVARTELADADEQRMRAHFAAFVRAVPHYDRVLIQHEYAFFNGRQSTQFSLQLFAEILAAIRGFNLPVTVIFHSAPHRGASVFSRRRRNWKKIAGLINSAENIDAVMHNRAAMPDFIDAGFDRHKITVHQMPMDRPSPLPPRDDDGLVNLAIFGFVAQYKGYADAIAALHLLPDNYRLIIAGGPHPHERHDKTFQDVEESANPRVELTGWLEETEIPRVLTRADIVLAPYREDGPIGSGAAMRALVYGRPSIVTDTPTFRDIQRGSNCFAVVPPCDPVALASEIRSLAGNAERRRALVERGFAHAEAHGFSAFVDRILENQDKMQARKAR